MIKTDVKEMLESGDIMYNDTDVDTLEFFKKAVKLDPEFLKNDILCFVEFTKKDIDFSDPLGFSFAKEYKEIFAPLNLKLRYDE